MANIITISGKARHGKDTFGELLYNELTNAGNKVIVFHYADFLKFIATKWFNWNGEKDMAGRTLLQYLGTDVFRTNRPDCWVNMAKEFILGLGDIVDYVLIPDTRFVNEIEVMREINPDKFRSILVSRPNFDNGLSEEQKNHPSETSLDNYKFDIIVVNDGSIDDLIHQAKIVSNNM